MKNLSVMNFLNIPVNITYRAKENEILLETPLFVAFIKTTFGSEFGTNEYWMTYGCWEIFIYPLREMAKQAGAKIHMPNNYYFGLIHRLYRVHVLPQIKELYASGMNNRPHTYIFALPYFVNENGEWEIPDERDASWPNLKRVTYDKTNKYSEEEVANWQKRIRMEQINGVA